MLKAFEALIGSRPIRWTSGVFVALLGIYGTFFYDRKPDVTFEIVANASVIDVRETLGKLTITYDGTNLQATNQHLHLLTLRITNNSSVDILKSFFDDADPLGFRVSVGKILEQPTFVAHESMRNSLRVSLRDVQTVVLAPLILNAGDVFEIKTLLLVPGNQIPSVSPIGRIAGVKEIRVSEMFRDSRKQGYLAEAFGGDAWVQAGRLGGYLFAGIFLIIASIAAIALPAAVITEAVQKRARRRSVERFRSAADRRLTLKEEYLAKLYVEGSPSFNVFRSILWPEGGFAGLRRTIATQESSDGKEVNRFVEFDFEDEYQDLEAAGLIIRDGPQVTISADFADAAKEFLNFVAPLSKVRKAGQDAVTSK